ncbi:hypothetical protein NHQ30_008570 [Ciborinia camelliae]|nr:hypothetical protein NHQ30_008570 [Ciborinia camelliae]
MRAAIILGGLASIALACINPDTDPCALAFKIHAAEAGPFCAKYTQSSDIADIALPAFVAPCGNKPKKISRACHCMHGKTTLATVARSTSAVVVHSAAPSSNVTSVAATTTANGTVARTSVASKSTSKATSKATTYTAVTPTTSKAVTPTATQAVITAVPSAPAGCTATTYADIASVVAKCKNIVLHNIFAPANSPIDLRNLQRGSTVTFSGKTTFGTTRNYNFDVIIVQGTDITITGAPGHVIDGNGQAYWDRYGSNGGSAKPDHFFVVKDVVNGVISNLNIQNWPVHCFSITGAKGLLITGLNLDNSAGDAPNALSGGQPAAHNTDGFDISHSDSVTLKNNVVKNQDDCVAVTSGSNILVTEMTCLNGHGLSVGSVGGKSSNVVSNVTFSNSIVQDSENGCRIKSNAGTTGTINTVLFKNIKMSNIKYYGIGVQQDYLNGGPTGRPTNGVKISGVTFEGVTGTTKGSSAYDHYILCGSGSCTNFQFNDVKISGGGRSSKCNFPSTGCPA